MGTVLVVLSFSGAMNCGVLALGFARSPSLPRRLFALLAATLLLILAGTAVMESWLIEAVPHLARLHVPLNYLLPPLFYLWVRASLERTVGRHAWAHLLPALARAASLAPFYVLSGSEKLAVLAGQAPQTAVRLGFLLVEAFVYMVLTVAVLIRRDPERLQRPLWNGTLAMALMWGMAAVRLATGISPLWVPAGIALMTFLVLASLVRNQAADPPQPRAKYARSTLRDDRSDRYARQLTELFERDKPYLDPGVSLELISEKTGIRAAHVSQTINQRFSANFNEWVNGYRIREAMNHLRSPRSAHLSLVAIAEASGFASKSTFNAAFRKATGMTPSEFRRRTESADETS